MGGLCVCVFLGACFLACTCVDVLVDACGLVSSCYFHSDFCLDIRKDGLSPGLMCFCGTSVTFLPLPAYIWSCFPPLVPGTLIHQPSLPSLTTSQAVHLSAVDHRGGKTETLLTWQRLRCTYVCMYDISLLKVAV